MVLSVSIHCYIEPFVISWLYGSPVMMWSQLWWLCASELLYSRSCTVIIRCALRGTLLRCPVRPRVTVPVFRYVLLLRWSSCRESWSTSYYIVATLVLHSWSPWTLFYLYTVLIILDNDLMMTWWFLLLLPIMDSTYRVCQLCRWFLDDVVVMSLLRCRYWCCLLSPFRPATFLSSRWWSAVRAPVQLVADEHLLRRWWISRLQPLMPSELDKQFVSDKWTLDDDDDPDDSSLPDLTWLTFVYCNDYCIIVLNCMLHLPHRLQWVLVLFILLTSLSARGFNLVLLTCIIVLNCIIALYCVFAYSPSISSEYRFHSSSHPHVCLCICISLAGRTIYLSIDIVCYYLHIATDIHIYYW